MAKKKKSLEDTCFPIPQNFSLTTTAPEVIELNETVKKSLFQQTIQTAYQIKIPYGFTSRHSPENPHQLVSEEQMETVSSLFQALHPKDAIEAALAQQFIIVHLQAIRLAIGGVSEKDIKKFELTHQILETLQKYRCKGAQQISVQYLHQSQVVNDQSTINIHPEPITLEGKIR